MSFTWGANGPNQLTILARDVQREASRRMSNPDRPRYDGREHTRDPFAAVNGLATTTRATLDRFEPIAPRTRVSVKRLANGEWQPDMTVESFDADPLTEEGRARIRERMAQLSQIVDELIEDWEAKSDG